MKTIPFTPETLYANLVSSIMKETDWDGKKPAWVCSWHIARKLKLKTPKVNYELNKLVKSGKLLKKTSTSYTSFSPVELDGWVRDGDYFITNLKTK